MKGQTFEGGTRVPLIAWWPGRLPAGRVSDEPAIIMDLYTTSLIAAGLAPPADRIIDGKNILPLLASDAKSPHEALFSFKGDRLHTVRSGKWKLHVAQPGRLKEKVWKPDEEWIDHRRPDGVRIIAPCEQAHPSQYPGVRTGDAVAELGLFNLEDDRAEQHNVAADHPELVHRLKALADRFKKELSPAN